jgi:DNA invertase Pin-like site-specific DNA recombinase
VISENKTKVILYARFSPRPNAAECESCESQLSDLRQYAWKRGYEIAGEFQDKALSGGDDWTDRPGMLDAATACKRGYILVVRAFDRLFRDTRKALMFAADLERKGVKIRSITEEAASLDTPEAEFMRAIFLALAQYQRAMIKARTRAKMLQHQKEGRKMSCSPPYGLQVDPANPKRLIPNPAEQAIIVTIKELHGKLLPLRAIARTLESRGIPRRGKPTWTHQLVKAILQREGLLA